MKRELPILEVGDTRFYIDTMKEMFVESGNSGNVIPYTKLRDYSDGVRSFFFYDKQTKNVADRDFPAGRLPEGIILVIVPSILTLDMPGLLQLAGKKIEPQEGKELQPKIHTAEIRSYVHTKPVLKQRTFRKDNSRRRGI